MSGLDPRSITFVAGALALVMGVVLASLRRSYPPSVGGLRDWAAAPALGFVTALLFGGRGVLPDALSIVVANLLLCATALLFYSGTRRFLGHRPHTERWMPPILVLAVPLAWYTYLQPDYTARIVVVNMLLVAIHLAHLLFLRRHGRRGFALRLSLLALAALAAIVAVRALSVLAQAAGRGIFDVAPIQVWYTSTYALGLLVFCIGAVLMASDRVQHELHRLATHDGLTGILTRGAVLQACDHELQRLRRGAGGRGMALMMVDVDHFKQVNDRHGHLVGDRVLADFAARVSGLLRPHDRFGRYGGEEFVVMLPDTPLAAAETVARRICADRTAEAGLPPVSTSIGLTVSRGADDALDAMLARADAALYQAKHAGRDRTHSLP